MMMIMIIIIIIIILLSLLLFIYLTPSLFSQFHFVFHFQHFKHLSFLLSLTHALKWRTKESSIRLCVLTCAHNWLGELETTESFNYLLTWGIIPCQRGRMPNHKPQLASISFGIAISVWIMVWPPSTNVLFLKWMLPKFLHTILF